MKSRISFFNAGFFRSNLKRFWPLWAVYFAELYVSLPLVTLLSGGDTEQLLQGLRNYCGGSATASTFVIGIVTAMAVFSFMYNQRTLGMISSMPIRREAVFGSALLSGLLPVLSINIIIAVLTAIPAAGKNTAVVIKSVLTWFGVYSLEFIIFYGIAVLTAMMTGMLIGLPILYGIFNFLIPGVETMIRWVLQIFTFGMNSDTFPYTEIASPFLHLINRCSDIYNPWYTSSGAFDPKPLKYEYWGTLVIYALLALVCVIIALLMFRRRETERTGDVIAVKSLRPVFKYGVTVCMALGLGLLFYVIFEDTVSSTSGSAVLLSLTMIFGAFVGFFASDMLLKKSFHVFRGNWRGFVTMAVLCIVLIICCENDAFGIERYVPDADDVRMINISGEQGEYTMNEEFEPVLELHRNIIEDKDKYVDTYGEFFDRCTMVNIDYIFKNGRCVTRHYWLYWHDDEGDRNAEAYSEIINSVRAVLDRYSPEIAVTADNIVNASIEWIKYDANGDIEYERSAILTPEEMEELYEKAILADIRSGGYRTDREFAPYAPNTELRIGIDLCEGYRKNNQHVNMYQKYDYLTILVDANEKETVQWIRDKLGWDIYPEKGE